MFSHYFFLLLVFYLLILKFRFFIPLFFVLFFFFLTTFRFRFIYFSFFYFIVSFLISFSFWFTCAFFLKFPFCFLYSFNFKLFFFSFSFFFLFCLFFFQYTSIILLLYVCYISLTPFPFFTMTFFYYIRHFFLQMFHFTDPDFFPFLSFLSFFPILPVHQLITISALFLLTTFYAQDAVFSANRKEKTIMHLPITAKLSMMEQNYNRCLHTVPVHHHIRIPLIVPSGLNKLRLILHFCQTPLFPATTSAI